MGLAPSERASKIIIIDLRDHAFDELGALPLVEGGGVRSTPLTRTFEFLRKSCFFMISD